MFNPKYYEGLGFQAASNPETTFPSQLALMLQNGAWSSAAEAHDAIEAFDSGWQCGRAMAKINIEELQKKIQKFIRENWDTYQDFEFFCQGTMRRDGLSKPAGAIADFMINNPFSTSKKVGSASTPLSRAIEEDNYAARYKYLFEGLKAGSVKGVSLTDAEETLIAELLEKRATNQETAKARSLFGIGFSLAMSIDLNVDVSFHVASTFSKERELLYTATLRSAE